jgi:hypothetical protein
MCGLGLDSLVLVSNYGNLYFKQKPQFQSVAISITIIVEAHLLTQEIILYSLRKSHVCDNLSNLYGNRKLHGMGTVDSQLLGLLWARMK